MKKIKKIFAIAGCVAVSLQPLTLMAADWTITQGATLNTANPDVSQGTTALVTDSIQAINGINLETGIDSLVSGSQEATSNAAAELSLTQGGFVAGARQAINQIDVDSIGSTGNAVTQTVSGSQTGVSLTQSTDGAGATGGNLQSVNMAEADTTIVSLTQEGGSTATLTLTQSAVPTNENTQAINYASGNQLGVDDTDKLDQSLTISGVSSLTQTGTGGQNRQVVNAAIGTGTAASIADVEQTYTAVGGLTMSQDSDTTSSSSGSNIQALNFADTSFAPAPPNPGDPVTAGGSIVNLNQETQAQTSVSVTSDSTSGNNIQAGNLAIAGTDIDTSIQSFSTSGGVASAVDFTLSGEGTGNRQAANLSQAAGTIDGLSQTFVATASNSLGFSVTAGSTGTQAGNLSDGDTLGDVDQEFTAPTAANTMFEITTAANDNKQGGNVANATVTITDLTQIFTGGTAANGTLTYLISTTGDDNIQAGNIAESEAAIASVDQTFTAPTSGALLFTYHTTATGSNNSQAGNIVISGPGTIALSEQTFTGSTAAGAELTFVFAAPGTANMQAGNLLISQGGILGSGNANEGTLTDGQQTFTAPTGSALIFTYDPAATGDNNYQAANMINVGPVTASTQTFTGSTAANANLSFTHSGAGDNNTQVANLLRSTGTIANSDQSFSAPNGSVLMFAHAATGANNIQAGNMAITPGNITDLEQTFTASGSTDLTFSMTATAGANTQAGNLVSVTGNSSDIAGITQSYTGSNTANTFLQESVSNQLIQAGNLIDLNTGGISDTTGPHQTYTSAGTVSMTQRSDAGGTAIGGTANLQALNAVVDDTGGTAAVNVGQTFTASTVVMAQNGVAGSGQFGNFAGMRYSP